MAKQKYDSTKSNAQKEEIANFTTAKMKEIAEGLKNPDSNAVQQLKDYFKQFSNFHNYSARNVVIMTNQAYQRGTHISKVQSFKDWASLKNDEGEKVSILKGSTGFKIFVPVQKTEYKRNAATGEFLLDGKNNRIPELKEDGTPKKSTYFNLGTVFDISQTNALDIGAIKKSHIFTAAKENSLNIDNDFVLKMQKNIEDNYKLPITFEAINNLSSGYNQKSIDKSIIVIDENMKPEQKLSVMFHELGHHIMHKFGNEISKEQKEGEAESFAYVLSSKFGVDNNSAECAR
jgi:hypothetical protein